MMRCVPASGYLHPASATPMLCACRAFFPCKLTGQRICMAYFRVLCHMQECPAQAS